MRLGQRTMRLAFSIMLLGMIPWLVACAALLHQRYQSAQGVVDVFQDYSLQSIGDITLGQDGAVWMTDQDIGSFGTRLHRISTAGKFRDVRLPDLDEGGPLGIATASDGAFWLTVQRGYYPGENPRPDPDNYIYRVKTSGLVKSYRIPTAGGQPYGVAIGRRDVVWFTEFTAGKIGWRLPNGVFHEVRLLSPKAHPTAIAASGNGSAWFLEGNVHRIGLVDLKGRLLEFPVRRLSKDEVQLCQVATDDNGNGWFTTSLNIGKITRNGQVTYFDLAPGHQANCIMQGADGAMWFTEHNAVGRLSRKGNLTEFPMPANALRFIISGSDGNIWIVSDAPGGFQGFGQWEGVLRFSPRL